MLASRVPLRLVTAAATVGLACFALATVAIAYTRLSDNVALIWVAGAPLLAALCVWPGRTWWAFAATAFIGFLSASAVLSPYGSLIPVFALVNVAEAIVAAAIVRRRGLSDELFVTTRSIPIFVAVALGAAALGGLPIAVALQAAHGAPLATTWGNWLIGHALGSIIGMPLALLILRRSTQAIALPSRIDIGRVVGVTALVAATTALVFSQDRFPLLFLPILPVLVATFTLRGVGAAGSIVIVAAIGAAFTLAGQGPVNLLRGDEALQLQFFQFYVGTLFVVALPVATTLIQRDRLLRALGTSEARYRLVADHATDIMLTLSPVGRIEYVSPSIRELGYHDPQALVGTHAMALVDPSDRDRVRATHLQAIDAPDRTFRVEYRARKANGDTGWFESNARAVLDDAGGVTAIVSVIRDLAHRKAREEELERAAAHDPMTGLLNREAFRRSVGMALHRARRDPARRATLALIDLDHFKAVNDTHGHGAGDTAILLLADVMRGAVRATDGVGRIGGEEFAILFDGIGIEAAEASCDRIRLALAHEAIPCAGGSFRVTASIGLVEVAPDLQIDRLFARADTALYAAKRNGRDRVERATA